MPAPRRLAALVLVLAPLAATAQPQSPSPEPMLTPGDARLALDSVLAPASSAMRLSMARGEVTAAFGTMTETVRVLPGGDRVRVQRLTTARGSQTDSLVFTAALVPRSHDSVNPGRTVSLRYVGGAVTGTYATATGTTAIEDAMASSAFDSNVIDLVARAVPLREGFAADVPTYERAAATSTVTDVVYTVRVTGNEVVNGHAGVVVAFGKPGAGETRLVVDPQTRRVLRMTADVAPGVAMIAEPED